MTKNARYPNRRRPAGRKKGGGGKRSRTLKIKPGADVRLKKVFATIGVPEQKPFRADRFQLEAVEAIRHSDCLVTAPTGAGKTWIAQQAIADIREQNGRAWYASPLKALSNAKHAEFSEFFGEQHVGILTGDRKENPEAPIIVGTTEILRNHLYDAMYRGESLETDLVILDEAHFLGDAERGVVWEEVMIYLPARIPLLLLSATVGNAGQIADWLVSIRKRECRVVAETQRPVPLYPVFFHPTGTLMPLAVRSHKQGTYKLSKKVAEFAHARRVPSIAPPGKLPPFGDMLRVLRKYRLLPAIFFLKSRADCDHALSYCMNNWVQDPERRDALTRRIEEITARSPHIAGHRQRWHLENLALGSHHSGQLPAWKLILETLMSEGLLDAVFATSTVAAGVNFPARTVVFFNSDRFNGRDFIPLTPTEFHQMTGRAGRRGMDNIGFAVAVPGRYMDLRHVVRLLSAAPSDVLSQIKINFSMALNLLLSHIPDQIEELLDRSFATHLLAHDRSAKAKGDKAIARARSKFLWQDFIRHLEFLQEHDYVNADGTLTPDGYWASRLRVDQPLLIAEGFRKQAFPSDNPALMAAIFSCFVFERESDDRIDAAHLPKVLLNAFLHIKESLTPFARAMLAGGFDARPIYLRPAAAIFAWAGGRPWETALAIAEMEEGIFASLVLRTADNLRHIIGLRDIFPDAAASAATALDLIIRDPVSLFY
jgi:superfamily II RNA helicase